MSFRSQITTFVLLSVLVLSGLGCGRFTTSSVDEEKEAHYLAGKNRLYSYDFKGAKEAFEKSLRVIPESAAAHLELGLLNYKEFENYAEAIHHFEKMLGFRADHPLSEQIKDHIQACKMSLASEVTLPPVNQRIEAELKQMIRENQSLTNLVAQLRGQVAQLENSVRLAQASAQSEAAATAAAVPSRGGRSDVRASAPAPRSTVQASAPTSRNRAMYLKHVLRPGDTFYSLARQYRLKVDALQKVNPGLRPKALKVGQVVNIPLSQTASAR